MPNPIIPIKKGNKALIGTGLPLGVVGGKG